MDSAQPHLHNYDFLPKIACLILQTPFPRQRRPAQFPLGNLTLGKRYPNPLWLSCDCHFQ